MCFDEPFVCGRRISQPMVGQQGSDTDGYGMATATPGPLQAKAPAWNPDCSWARDEVGAPPEQTLNPLAMAASCDVP